MLYTVETVRHWKCWTIIILLYVLSTPPYVHNKDTSRKDKNSINKLSNFHVWAMIVVPPFWAHIRPSLVRCLEWSPPSLGRYGLKMTPFQAFDKAAPYTQRPFKDIFVTTNTRSWEINCSRIYNSHSYRWLQANRIKLAGHQGLLEIKLWARLKSE